MDVQKYAIVVPVSREALDDDVLPPFPEMMRQIEENARRFRALPPEEQARIKAEREAAYEAERCQACGCHPDEHNSY
jgi:uncharacterized protein YqiB (DUF1249 family)